MPHPRLDDLIDLAAMAGIRVDEWQEKVLDGATWVNGNRWAASTVGLNVPRQAGKGTVLEVRQIGGLYLFNERLQVHTAHEFKTCFEHFRRVKELIEGTPALVKQVKIIRTGAGDQAIELKNGNRLRFLARSRSSIRGFTIDTLYFDEAYALTDEVLGSALPALSARANRQVWYTSSAPHANSEVFHRIRARALSGEPEPRLFYAGWENSPDVDPADPEAWYTSNPGLNIRLPIETVADEQATMNPTEFARERLGIPEGGEGAGGPIDVDQWRQLGDAGNVLDDSLPHVLAVDVSPDRQWTSIGAAGWQREGVGLVEVVKRDRGTAWVVPFFREAVAKRPNLKVVLDAGGPAGGLLAELVASGITVDEVGVRDHAQACGAFLDAVLEQRIRHRNQVALNDAVAGARQRQSQDVWLWSRAGSAVDISPLVAVTLAWGKLPAPVREVWAVWG